MEDNVNFAISCYLLKLSRFDIGDSWFGFFVEPVDHEIFGPLAIVFDLLAIAEVDEGGESLDFV